MVQPRNHPHTPLTSNSNLQASTTVQSCIPAPSQSATCVVLCKAQGRLVARTTGRSAPVPLLHTSSLQPSFAPSSLSVPHSNSLSESAWPGVAALQPCYPAKRPVIWAIICAAGTASRALAPLPAASGRRQGQACIRRPWEHVIQCLSSDRVQPPAPEGASPHTSRDGWLAKQRMTSIMPSICHQ